MKVWHVVIAALLLCGSLAAFGLFGLDYFRAKGDAVNREIVENTMRVVQLGLLLHWDTHNGTFPLTLDDIGPNELPDWAREERGFEKLQYSVSADRRSYEICGYDRNGVLVRCGTQDDEFLW